jgi:type I restriction enzyme S subunit
MAGEWRDTTIGEHVELVTGEAFQSARFGTTPDSGTLLARGDNVKEGEFEWGEKARYWPELTPDLERYLLREDDVLLGMDGSKVGKNWVRVRSKDLPCLLVQRVARLRAKPTMDQRFLRYLIGNPQFREYIERVRTGTSIPHISGGQIKSYEISLPSLSEQKAIAGVLGALDDKIELNRRMNGTLEAMARALFQSWFVDFYPVRAKLDGRHPTGMDQATADLFPDSFDYSSNGVIPKGWTVDAIKTRATNIQYGFTQSSTEDPIGPHFLRITDIRGGKIEWSSVPFCKTTEDEREKYRVMDGDIYIARTGASTGDSIYVVEPPSAVFASYLIRLQFASRGIGRIVGEFIRTPDYANYIAGNIGGTAQPNANAQTLTAASMVFPTEEIADAFYRIVRPFDLQRAANDRESRILADLRDTLLPKLLSGELSITKRTLGERKCAQ